MSQDEVVQVNPVTGAKKAGNLQRVGLIPPEFILALAKHYGVGSQKYADHNWRKGYDWEWSYNSAQRHLMAFWMGEDIDPETKSPHVICAAWHCASLFVFMSEHPELDTRWSTVNAALAKGLRGELNFDNPQSSDSDTGPYPKDQWVPTQDQLNKAADSFFGD